MTINYTNLLGLAKPVTGTETGQWGDVVNDQITELVEDAVANSSSISVTSGDVTLTTTTGSANQARMAVLLITGSPGVSRNIIAPSQSKWYIVKNSSNASIVVKGSATTGVTILADTEALVFWNGSDFEVAGLVGPSSSTDNAVARFDSTTGKVIQNSGVTIDDSNNVSGVAQLNATTADLTNLEVTNIKAKDGTAAASIADSTGVISITSNPVLSGGTANGVLYLNGSKIATSGSALTFDGATLGVSRAASSDATLAIGNTTDIYTANYGKQGNTAYGATAAGDAFFYTSTKNISIMADGAPSVIKFSAGGNTEGMRLTSTGLGIGTSSPWTKLSVYGSGNQRIAVTSPTGGATVAALDLSPSLTNGEAASYDPQARIYAVDSNYSANIIFANKATGAVANSLQTRMTLDTSGNLGLGVTPSAWTTAAATQALQITNYGAALSSNGAGNTWSSLTHNAYFDGTNWKYTASTVGATLYQMTGANSGSTHSWSVAAGGTAGNAISFTQAMTLDASGNLSVGTTSAISKLTVQGASDIRITVNESGSSVRTDLISQTTQGQVGTVSNHPLDLITNGTGRARITSGGYLLVGTTSTAGDARLVVNNPDNVSGDFCLVTYLGSNCNDTSSYHYIAVTGGLDKLYIYGNGNIVNTNNSYGTLSDAKMKTDIVDAGSQWADIKAVRFRKFKMKNDPTGLVQLGVVAQELEQTSPRLVDEHPDYEEVEITDEDGNVKKERQPTGTTTKSVKTSVLLMKAAVALQEAMARIEQLEAKVAALESKGV